MCCLIVNNRTDKRLVAAILSQEFGGSEKQSIWTVIQTFTVDQMLDWL